MFWVSAVTVNEQKRPVSLNAEKVGISNEATSL